MSARGEQVGGYYFELYLALKQRGQSCSTRTLRSNTIATHGNVYTVQAFQLDYVKVSGQSSMNATASALVRIGDKLQAGAFNVKV